MGCANDPFGTLMPGGAPSPPSIVTSAGGRRALGENLRPEEIVVVGDTPFDIRCGKFIGAKVLAVATGGAKLDELKRHQPDWAVEDLTRVTAREVCA